MTNPLGDNSQTQMGSIISNGSALPSIISDDSALPSIPKNAYFILQTRVAEALSGLASSENHVRNFNQRVENFDRRLSFLENSRSTTSTDALSTGALPNGQLTLLKAEVRDLGARVNTVEDSSRVAINAGTRLNDMASRLQGLEDTQASLREGVQQAFSDFEGRLVSVVELSQVTSSRVDRLREDLEPIVYQSASDLATLSSKFEEIFSPIHRSPAPATVAHSSSSNWSP